MKTKLKQVITTAASACLVSTCYVDLNRANPKPPFAGDEIVVTNGFTPE
jgi:hypothetical protein